MISYASLVGRKGSYFTWTRQEEYWVLTKSGNRLDTHAAAFSLWLEGSRRACHMASHPPHGLSHHLVSPSPMTA